MRRAKECSISRKSRPDQARLETRAEPGGPSSRARTHFTLDYHQRSKQSQHQLSRVNKHINYALLWAQYDACRCSMRVQFPGFIGNASFCHSCAPAKVDHFTLTVDLAYLFRQGVQIIYFDFQG